jgi:hypothetical protein
VYFALVTGVSARVTERGWGGGAGGRVIRVSKEEKIEGSMGVNYLAQFIRNRE